MNRLLSTCTIAIAAALISSRSAGTPISFAHLSNGLIGLGSDHVWTSGPLDLSGHVIGPGEDPLELSLRLDGTVNRGPENHCGAYIVVSPAVPVGAEIFGFTYQLRLHDVALGAPFGFELYNGSLIPIATVSTWTSGGPADVFFDGVDVTLYNRTLTESVSTFQVFIFSVPDSAPTLALIALGLAVAAAARLARLSFRPSSRAALLHR